LARPGRARSGGARLLALLLFVTLFASPAARLSAGAPKTRKIDRALQALVTGDPAGTARAIIRVKKGAAASVVTTLESHGGRVVGTLSRGRSIVAEIHNADIASLAGLPGVETLSIDGKLKAHAASLADQPPVTGDLLRAAVGVSPTGPTGRGVGVAVIDSGIAKLADFDHQIRAFYDFTRGGKAVAPFDDYGHGTHIAGLIGSDGGQTKGRYAGIAPEVSFIGLKVLDESGNGRTSDVIAAIEFATAHRARLGIDIINLSLGHPIFEPAATDPLVQAVEKAVQAGIVVVVSAGNGGMDPETGDVGYAGIESPGNAPSAITVGATMTLGTAARGDDQVVDYSSRGPTWFDGLAKPDLVAPGQRLVSNAIGSETLYKLYPSWRYPTPAGGSGKFLRLSGTSMSTGVVSGVAALVIEAHRATRNADGTVKARIAPYDVKAILEYTATSVTGADALSQGAGEVNAAGAVALTQAIDTRWTPWAIESLTPASTIGGETLPWVQTVIWGNYPLTSSTADDLISLAHIVWLNHVTWGADLVSADRTHIVWGNDTVTGNLRHIVWGNDIVEANLRHIVWGNDSVEANRWHIVWGNDIVEANLRHIVWGNACAISEVCF